MAGRSLLCFPEEQRALLESYLPGNPPRAGVHVTLTYAQSLDAQIAILPDVQTALSGMETKAMTHYLRARHDAIVIGVGTAEADDPSLNCRYSADGVNAVGMTQQPIPVVLDPSARWSCKESCNLLSLARNTLGRPPIWVICSEALTSIDDGRCSRFKEVGGTIIVLDNHEEKIDWSALLLKFQDRDIRSVMVEGGGKVIKSLLHPAWKPIVQSYIVTIAPVWLGQGGVQTAPERGSEVKTEVKRLKNMKWIQMGEDVVMAGRAS